MYKKSHFFVNRNALFYRKSAKPADSYRFDSGSRCIGEANSTLCHQIFYELMAKGGPGVNTPGNRLISPAWFMRVL